MMAYFNRNPWWVLVAAIAILAGCGGAEERKAKYLERGKTYYESERYDKAAVEFKNVLQIDPKVVEAWYYMANISEKAEDLRTAFGNYAKVVELDPNHMDARRKLGHYHLLFGTQEGAEEQVDWLLENSPNDPDAMTMQAALLARNGDLDGAIAKANEVLKLHPEHLPVLAVLAQLYREKGDLELVVKTLEKAVEQGPEQSPEQVAQRLNLARAYADSGKYDAAASVLEGLIAEYPDRLPYRVALASFYSQLDHLDKAEQVLRDAIEANPSDSSRHLLLAEFLLNKRGWEATEKNLLNAIKQQPEMIELQLGLARLYEVTQHDEKSEEIYRNIISREGGGPVELQAKGKMSEIKRRQGDLQEAESLVSAVLKENPTDNQALLVRGKLELQAEKYREAVGTFRTILKDQPESAETLNLLAAAHRLNGELGLAEDTLRLVLKLNPESTAARLELMKFLIAKSDWNAALEQAKAVLDKEPVNKLALLGETEIYAGMGDSKALEEVINTVKKVMPDSAEGYFRMGRLRMVQQKYEQALQEFEQAYNRAPENTGLVADIIAAERALGRTKESVDRLNKIIAKRPTDVIAYGLLANVNSQEKNYEAALKSLEKAYELSSGSPDVLVGIIKTEMVLGRDKDSIDRLKKIIAENPGHINAHVMLAGAYFRQKDMDASAKEYLKQIEITPKSASLYLELSAVRSSLNDLSGEEQALKDGLKALPDDTGLLLGLAGMYARHNNYDEAERYYEEVLQLSPENVVAVNNLAALLADHRSDPKSMERAMQLAGQLANAKEPILLDTLGWVHFKRGEFSEAIEVLTKVVDAAPDVSVYRYHLGMAYFNSGDRKAAKEHLAKALESGQPFEGSVEAEKVLEQLK